MPRCCRSATRSRSSRTSGTPRASTRPTGSPTSPARTRSGTCGWRPSPRSTSRARTRTGRIPYSDVAVVHNGQLTNYFMWRRRLERAGRRFMSECDSEIIAVYLAEEMSKGSTFEEAMHQSLDELDGVFTYIAVTKDELGVAKDELAAKPLVLYESDDLVALASEEIAIRQIVDHEIDTYDPYEREVLRCGPSGCRRAGQDLVRRARARPSRSRTRRAPRSSRTASRPSTRTTSRRGRSTSSSGASSTRRASTRS